MLRTGDNTILMSIDEAKALADLLSENGYTSIPAALDLAADLAHDNRHVMDANIELQVR